MCRCHKVFRQTINNQIGMMQVMFASVVQWFTFPSLEQKIMGSNPSCSKEVCKLSVSVDTQKYGSWVQPSCVKIPHYNENLNTVLQMEPS